jgi:hypothetical protein
MQCSTEEFPSEGTEDCWVPPPLLQSFVVAIDQIIFVTEQKGIQEIVLHHLFKWPGLYGD